MRFDQSLRWVTIALIIALGASIWWGVTQLRLHKDFAIKLENNYQRAFHELVWHIQTVENELAMLSAAGSAQQEREKLATVWRQLYAAQEKVGQLPLGLVPLENAEKYLSTTGDQIFALVRRGSNLSAAERAEVDKMQRGAAQLASELASLQQTVLTRNLRWTDVEAALVQARREEQVQDNTVLNGLSLVNKQVQEYPEVQFDQRIGVVQPQPNLQGPKISLAEAQERALWFLSPNDKSQYQVVSSELTDGIIPAYNLVLTTKEADRRVNVEITQVQGRVLWMLDNRQPETAVLPTAALQQRAADFLRRRGFKNMQLVGQHEYQGSVLFAYVYEQDGVLIYPDLLRVRVARDDGSVIGFEGNGYTAWHQDLRRLPTPKISIRQALEKLAQGLELIGPVQLAVVFDSSAQEALVYEIPAKRGADQFLIYVDTQTGQEVQIVRLDTSDLPRQTMALP
ncbi:MAG: germination protein YpeB [Firmicutes bacterium]|nr:germination protein YpeB [Bacillota bacterium]